MRNRIHVPSSSRIRLGPARRFYVQQLLNTGLYGNTPGEAVEILFSKGLQQVVTTELIRAFVPAKDRRQR